jgi:CRP-like cAMP-binding protein
VASWSAEQRLVAELVRLAEAAYAGKDTVVIDPVPPQQDLAVLIFTQREAVGRDMAKLKDAGLIERRGRALVIKSLSALQARLDSD